MVRAGTRSSHMRAIMPNQYTNNNPWTPRRQKLLEELRAQKYSYRVIASIINKKTKATFTLNAVAGRINRKKKLLNDQPVQVRKTSKPEEKTEVALIVGPTLPVISESSKDLGPYPDASTVRAIMSLYPQD